MSGQASCMAYHVDSHLAQVGVELSGETQRSGNARHDGGNEVVQVTVGGVGQLESTLADLVQSLVIDTEGLVRVFDQLMDGKSSVVGLNNGIGHLGRRGDTEGSHHTIGELWRGD